MGDLLQFPHAPAHPLDVITKNHGSVDWFKAQIERVFPWAVISAHRNDYKITSGDAGSTLERSVNLLNRVNDARLFADILANGYDVFPATEIEEESVFLFEEEMPKNFELINESSKRESFVVLGVGLAKAVELTKKYGSRMLLLPQGYLDVQTGIITYTAGYEWGNQFGPRIEVDLPGESISFTPVLDSLPQRQWYGDYKTQSA